jgi:hypothetical protein
MHSSSSVDGMVLDQHKQIEEASAIDEIDAEALLHEALNDVINMAETEEGLDSCDDQTAIYDTTGQTVNMQWNTNQSETDDGDNLFEFGDDYDAATWGGADSAS